MARPQSDYAEVRLIQEDRQQAAQCSELRDCPPLAKGTLCPGLPDLMANEDQREPEGGGEQPGQLQRRAEQECGKIDTLEDSQKPVLSGLLAEVAVNMYYH